MKPKKRDPINIIGDTLTRYKRLPAISLTVAWVNAGFLAISIPLLVIYLLAQNQEGYLAYSSWILLAAWPLGIAGFILGLASRWSGRGNFAGEALGIATILFSFIYAFAALTFRT